MCVHVHACMHVCVCVRACTHGDLVVSTQSTNMEDLREKTHTMHYERFRAQRLVQMGFADKGADNQPVRLASQDYS